MRSRNFTLEEFNVPAAKRDMAYVLMGHLQALRNYLSHKTGDEIPIVISSAYRSPEHNRKVGGVSSSHHIYRDSAGYAVAAADIWPARKDKVSVEDLYYIARPFFNGDVILYPDSHVHVSIAKEDGQKFVKG